MVKRKTWEEFRDSGLLWWINMILHTFGWAIVVVLGEGNEQTFAYPARVGFRGFDEGSNSIGYRRVSRYIKENSNELVKESED